MWRNFQKKKLSLPFTADFYSAKRYSMTFALFS